MLPTFTLPLLDVTVRSVDLCIQLAVVVAVLLGGAWAARLEGLDKRVARRAILLLALGALIGGRLHFLLNHAAGYRNNPFAALKIWKGGFHVVGILVGLVVVAPLVARRYRIPLAKLLDGITPALGVVLAVGRFGCFLQGCCFGDRCDGWWCLSFPTGSEVFLMHSESGLLPPGATRSLPIHPLQLYFSASYLLITALALWVHRGKRYDGEVALVALVALFASAFALEFLRSDQMFRIYWGPLPQLTWAALGMTLAAVTALGVAELRHARTRARRMLPLRADAHP